MMRKAKAFFYVSLGILALVVTAQLLGPKGAEGQDVGPLQAGEIQTNAASFSATDGNSVWITERDWNPPVQVSLPRPGNVIALQGRRAGSTVWVMYDDGDCFEHIGGTGWTYMGNILSAAVQTRQGTWGQLKDTYR